jgi:hypothetical protein
VELIYSQLSGDTTYTANAIRTLNWATYTVADDGRNRYIRDDIWLTDGYGDYIRHYLRAMSAMPELAPESENHLLGTSSVIASIVYSPDSIEYITFDKASKEVLRLNKKPFRVMADNMILSEDVNPTGNSWTWSTFDTGGVLRVNKREAGKVVIDF